MCLIVCVGGGGVHVFVRARVAACAYVLVFMRVYVRACICVCVYVCVCMCAALDDLLAIDCPADLLENCVWGAQAGLHAACLTCYCYAEPHEHNRHDGQRIWDKNRRQIGPR